MDGDNGLNIRNWGYYEPTTSSFKSHLGLQLMPSMPEKPMLGGRNASVFAGANVAFQIRDIGMPPATYPMDYMRDAWISPREKFLNMIPTNQTNYAVVPEASSAHHMQLTQPPDLSKEERPAEEAPVEKVCGTGKKRQGSKMPKSPKAKKPKKGPRVPKDENCRSVQRARTPKKTTEIVINGIGMNVSSIPIPVCSCTGTPQQCYRWGSGGWQSACCTTGMSVYPLPMSTKRRGARIAGRKMSIGAFTKVLEKLSAEGFNFSNPIDLKTYWAKHGTNKFVTIR